MDVAVGPVNGVELFEIALPVLYFITIWAYGKAFFSGSRRAEQVKTPLLISVVVVHFSYLILRTIAFNHPPITSAFETFSNVAFCITVAYTYIEFKTKVKSTGYFILILPFIFQLISSIFIKDLLEVPEVLRSNLLAFHVTSALLGYAAITVSAAYGFLYLMLHHDIKSTRFGVIYKRLPNLEVLERMSFSGIKFGFLLLTIAIVIGLIWLPRAFENFSYADPKLIGTLSIWLLYGVGLLGKQFIGWQGKKMMWLSLAGFALAVFSMTVINMVLGGFHKFY